MTASHYLVTVSSRTERTAAVYECLDNKVTKVPMDADVLSVANAPLSPAHRQVDAAILSPAEYNIAREATLRRLTTGVPDMPLQDYILGILSNHDFYAYRNIPPHQTLLQDSGKTINGFGSILSAVTDWSGNRVIVSYRSSYAGYGPFFAYNLSTGKLLRYRDEDSFTATGSFSQDNDFLDKAFALYRSKRMNLDRDGWEQLSQLICDHPGLNSLLHSDWTFTVACALGHFDDADRAAREIDAEFPDYYLGALDQGIRAYKMKHWTQARVHFLDSLGRQINFPATRFLALTYASLASAKAGDDKESANLGGQARDLLHTYWIPKDFDAQVRPYLADRELASFVHDIADK